MIYQMMFAVITPALISGAGTWALFKFLDWTIGLRVTEDKEILGLDLSEHGEAGYN
jgi:Amt family ammonium transporter